MFWRELCSEFKDRVKRVKDRILVKDRVISYFFHVPSALSLSAIWHLSQKPHWFVYEPTKARAHISANKAFNLSRIVWCLFIEKAVIDDLNSEENKKLTSVQPSVLKNAAYFLSATFRALSACCQYPPERARGKDIIRWRLESNHFECYPVKKGGRIWNREQASK